MAVGEVGIGPLQLEKQMKHREQLRDLRDEQAELTEKGCTRGSNNSKAPHNRVNGEAGATGFAG